VDPEAFDIMDVIDQLQLLILNEGPVLTCAADPSDNWIEDNDEGLFHRVPRRLNSFVQGVGVQTLDLSFNPENDSLDVQLLDLDGESQIKREV
jgi:hypothetical protein